MGATAERSYGPVIDEQLKHADARTLALHYGNDALGSLLQMQRRGRLEAVLGYWPEIRYHALQQRIASDDLSFYPIKGSLPYQRTHIACSDTALGRHAIERIDQVLRDIPQEQVQQSYAAWLDPVMREQYLRDNPRFSRTHPNHDKSQAKRNPEGWGDTSGLNVAYKDPHNKAQTPEHNVCSCCYEI